MYNGISRSFVLGYLLGLAGMPLKTALGAAMPPAADREKPAMFLYNGMGPLPAVPEGYDRCPYATVTDMGDGAYRLHLSDNPFFARLNDSGTFNLANYYKNTGILFYMFTRNAAAGSWSAYNPDILGTNRVIAGGREKGWTNYDMLTKDGDVYIQKTAAIPVIGGKENPIAPSVFLAGLRFGILSRHSNALPELPDGVLISSDGYILTDCNGVYLIAAADSEPDAPDDEPIDEPVAYLYNGVQLPPLPEWDREVYPYAVIVQNNSDSEIYGFMVDDETFTVGATGDTTRLFPGASYKHNDGEWVSASGQINCKAIWTNTDLYTTDGALSLERSDPVPVYE